MNLQDGVGRPAEEAGWVTEVQQAGALVSGQPHPHGSALL